MKDISLENLMDIIVRSLNQMDAQLTGHGERVAYCMVHLLEKNPQFSDEEICKITWIVLLHDIGNFHDIGISDLVKKEYNTDFSHARYGYLFLKYFSPFAEYAPLVLFHHSSHDRVDASSMSEKLKWVTKCLQIFDTTDLYHIRHPQITKQALLNYLKRLSTIIFSEEAIETIEQLAVQSPDNSLPFSLPPQEEIHEFLLKRLKRMDVTEHEEELLLRTLVNSIDFRSHYTAIHCNIMVHVSDLLARLCGLDEKTCRSVHLGALLHDLGKISIPLRILESNGKLEGADWVVMQAHVNITEHILQGKVSDEVLQIAIRHHETLDGKGYPYGLSSQDLTLPQRIVSVADIVSALSEQRSYKAPFTFEKILNILDEMCANGKICPHVVGILKENREIVYQEIQTASTRAMGIYERIQKEYNELGDAQIE